MQEWYALDAIARWRERHPDSRPHEEDMIFDHHMSTGDNLLLLRCEFNTPPEFTSP